MAESGTMSGTKSGTEFGTMSVAKSTAKSVIQSGRNSVIDQYGSIFVKLGPKMAQICHFCHFLAIFRPFLGQNATADADHKH